MSNDMVVGSITFDPVDKTANAQGSPDDRLAELQAEIERLREAAKGATVIANVASAEIRELRRLVRAEYVDDVACMCRLCYAEWGEDEAETHQAGCMAAERPAR